MDKTLDRKIRRLGPTPRVVLGSMIQDSYKSLTTTSAGTISDLKLGDNAAGGGYSVLSRNDLVEPFGRDAQGNMRWKLTEDVEKNKQEIGTLIGRLDE